METHQQSTYSFRIGSMKSLFYEPDYQLEEPPLKKHKTSTTTTTKDKDSVQVRFEFSCQQRQKYKIELPNGELIPQRIEIFPIDVKTFFIHNTYNYFKDPNNLQSDIVSMLDHVDLYERGMGEGSDFVSTFIQKISSKACELVHSNKDNPFMLSVGIKITYTDLFVRDLEFTDDFDDDGQFITSSDVDDNERESNIEIIPTSEKAIEELKKIEFDGGDSIINKECNICFDDFAMGLQVIRLPCSHGFHGDCITTWLKQNHLCPSCRFKMPV